MRIFLALLLLTVLAPLQAATKNDPVAAMQALAKLDVRLATLGHRIAVANAPYCANRTASLGWALHDISQYTDEASAKLAFGFQRPIQISAVVDGGPADAAGLSANDGLIRMQTRNATLNFHDADRPRSRVANRMDLWTLSIETALRQNTTPVVITVLRDGTELQFAATATPSCPSWFTVDPQTKTDAGANGDRVRVTSALIDFTHNDDELAAVVAHELAHNLLGHPAKLAKMRKDKTQAIRDTEIEADQLSVWLMSNAGYDPAASIRFWQRYGPKKSAGLFAARTHLPWKKRIALLTAETAEMKTHGVTGGKRAPPLLVNAASNPHLENEQ